MRIINFLKSKAFYIFLIIANIAFAIMLFITYFHLYPLYLKYNQIDYKNAKLNSLKYKKSFLIICDKSFKYSQFLNDIIAQYMRHNSLNESNNKINIIYSSSNFKNLISEQRLFSKNSIMFVLKNKQNENYNATKISDILYFNTFNQNDKNGSLSKSDYFVFKIFCLDNEFRKECFDFLNFIKNNKNKNLKDILKKNNLFLSNV